MATVDELHLRSQSIGIRRTRVGVANLPAFFDLVEDDQLRTFPARDCDHRHAAKIDDLFIPCRVKRAREVAAVGELDAAIRGLDDQVRRRLARLVGELLEPPRFVRAFRPRHGVARVAVAAAAAASSACGRAVAFGPGRLLEVVRVEAQLLRHLAQRAVEPPVAGQVRD
jgi:hypothetical protein